MAVRSSTPASIEFEAPSCGDPIGEFESGREVTEAGSRLPAASGGTQPAFVDLRQLTCTLAHELRQPLFTISMANENLRIMLESPETDQERMQQAVLRIAEQVQRAQAIIDQTLSANSEQIVRRHSTDVVDAARSSVGFIAELPEGCDVEFISQLPEERLLVGLPRIELEQVFVNLLRNAVESIADRHREGWRGIGRVSVTLQASGGDVRCVVSDNGAGVAAATLKTAFEPFVTTKASGGTGLGLHICRQIVSKAGGAIELKAGRVDGAIAVLRLPRVAYGTA